MILYKQQPQGIVDGVIRNRYFDVSQKTEILDGIRSKFTALGETLRYRDITALITDAASIDAMLAVSGYNNILVVTSYQKSEYPSLTTEDNTPVKSAGDHLLPIVHKLNESIGNMYVATPRNSSDLMTKLYDQYAIPKVTIDSEYKLDVPVTIQSDIKFDAVVLLGCGAYKKGNFAAKDIKKNFSKYCTPEFDLIHIDREHTALIEGKEVGYNGSHFPSDGAYLNISRKDMQVIHKANRKVTGTSKSTEVQFDKMRSIVLNINLKRKEAIQSDRGYERLFQNIDLIESNLIYRIY